MTVLVVDLQYSLVWVRSRYPGPKPSCGVTVVLGLLWRCHEGTNKHAETQEQEV
jgi:hypothetical protein